MTTANMQINANPQDYTLIIANKSYSSWSLRPWLILKHFNIQFAEKILDLANANFSQQAYTYGDGNAKTVPILIHNNFNNKIILQDSLAIAEYLAENHAHLNLWPQDKILRAQARYVCARMHSGFQELRKTYPMNTRRTPQALQQKATDTLQKDVQDIFDLWERCLKQANLNGPYLFGEFSIADAYFAPLVIRFNAYQIKSTFKLCEDYIQLMLKHPAMQEWFADAKTETTVIAKYEL